MDHDASLDMSPNPTPSFVEPPQLPDAALQQAVTAARRTENHDLTSRHGSRSNSFRTWCCARSLAFHHHLNRGNGGVGTPLQPTLKKSKSHGFMANLSSAGESEAMVAAASASPSRANSISVKGIFRRASVSLRLGVKGIVHGRPTEASAQQQQEQQQPLQQSGMRSRTLSALQPSTTTGHRRPSTSQSIWQHLRHATSSSHRQSASMTMPHTSHGEGLHGSHGHQELVASLPLPPPLPIPGSGLLPPIIPANTGAAARQAAASLQQESSDWTAAQPENQVLPPPPPPAASFVLDASMDDDESGIGIALTGSTTCLVSRRDNEEDDGSEDGDEDMLADSDVDICAVPLGLAWSEISKVDFVARLPVELAVQMLANLDAPSLVAASLVSWRWHWLIQNQHIWRESFLRERTATYATSGPVKPGTGVGVPAILPNCNWKEIYRVHDELDRRWREGKARPVYLNGHTDSIYCLQFDENKIVTGSRDKTIRVWDIKTFACKLVIGPSHIINPAHNDPASSPLLYDAYGNPVHHCTLPESDPPISPITNNQGGQPTPSSRAYPSVPKLVSFPIAHEASILCLQYDDRILVTGSSDATCIVHDVRDGYRPLRRLRHHSAAVLDLVFDERHIVTCSKDISICVWSRSTGELLKQLRGHSGPVNAVQMRGNTIVSCSGDFSVKLWNIATGKAIREFTGHTKGLACSQFTDDARYVASAGNDKVIRVWDANTGECVREMRAHENLVRSLHVDSVSGRLVSGSYDTDIKVFDMESGRQLLDFPRWHNSWVLSAKNDYRRIVSTGQDPKILVMDFGAGLRGIEMLETPPAPHDMVLLGDEGGTI